MRWASRQVPVSLTSQSDKPIVYSSADSDLSWDSFDPPASFSLIGIMSDNRETDSGSTENNGSGSADTTSIPNRDLAAIIALNSRNNYGKVLGLKFFQGGRSKDPSNPNVICETNVKVWLHDIDTLTSDDWTDAGRIQLAKSHAVGAAFRLISAVIAKEGENI